MLLNALAVSLADMATIVFHDNPLDGDDVVLLTKLFRARLDGQQGNLTDDEVDKLIRRLLALNIF